MIKKYFAFPYEKEYEGRINEELAQLSRETYGMLTVIITTMQLLMLILISTKPGGPFKTPRRTGYFSMYLFLFLCTLLFIGITWCMYNRNKTKAIIRMDALYSILLCAWACGVTFLDQYGGNGLSVYCYMLPTIATFNILCPWMTAVIFGVFCIGLNLTLPFLPHGMPNLFSNLVNSIFLTTMSVFISVILYNNRVKNIYDRIIIEKQYEQIRRMNVELNRMAQTDELTRLFNRRYLEEQIGEWFAKPENKGRLAAGIMIDIDFFKQYNDTYGHPAGDRVLQRIGEAISAFAEEEEAAAVRYGGEEFFICILDKAEQSSFAVQAAESSGADIQRENERQVMVLAEKLHSAIEKLEIERKDVKSGHVTVSIGAAVLKADGKESLTGLLEAADRALYKAKGNGRDQCCYDWQSGKV